MMGTVQHWGVEVWKEEYCIGCSTLRGAWARGALFRGVGLQFWEIIFGNVFFCLAWYRNRWPPTTTKASTTMESASLTWSPGPRQVSYLQVIPCQISRNTLGLSVQAQGKSVITPRLEPQGEGNGVVCVMLLQLAPHLSAWETLTLLIFRFSISISL